MHLQHDKHQYYFEKYLRNEMQAEEYQAFKYRLSEDEAFRKDFNHYQSHRNEIIEGELKEYEQPEILLKKPQKWGWVYAVLSLLCIVLIVDYFLSVRYAASVQTDKKREPLTEKINIFKKKESPRMPESGKSNRKESIIENDTTLVNDSLTLDFSSNVDKEIEPYLEPDLSGIKGEYFLSDSLFYVFEKTDIEKRIGQLKTAADSLLGDSLLELMVVKTAFKSLGTPKRQLLIEFWDSPLHFKGYVFNGKRLVLYNMNREPDLTLVYEDKATVYHLFISNYEYHLFNDGRIHQIAE